MKGVYLCVNMSIKKKKTILWPERTKIIYNLIQEIRKHVYLTHTHEHHTHNADSHTGLGAFTPTQVPRKREWMKNKKIYRIEIKNK